MVSYVAVVAVPKSLLLIPFRARFQSPLDADKLIKCNMQFRRSMEAAAATAA